MALYSNGDTTTGGIVVFFPFCTYKDIEVAQSPLSKDGFTTVHFEQPDEIYCFKTVDVLIPTYAVSGIIGFTSDEVAELVSFCQQMSHLLLKYAKVPGGINNA